VTPEDEQTTVAVPAVVLAIKETVTVPVASAVITVALDKVPSVVVKFTVVPAGTGFPLASLTVAVMALELEPSAGMLVGEATRVMYPTPPPKMTVTDCVTLFEVAVTVAAPAVVPAIKETVTIPVSSAVVTLALDKVPSVVVKFTVVPAGTGFPLASLTVAVIALELEPSAGMLVGDAVRVMDPTPPLVKVRVVLPDTKLAAVAWITTLPAIFPAV